MAEKKFITLHGYKSIDKDNHIVEVVVSDETVDRDNEVILASAWDIENYMKNPVLLDSHTYRGIDRIIGKAEDLRVEDGKLIARFKYFVGKGNILADYAWALVENGLASYSVGFIPKNWDRSRPNADRTYTQVELLEISQVTVPANPNAVIGADANDTLLEAVRKAFEELQASKAVVPYSKADWFPDNTSWDANRARREALQYAGGKENFDPKKYRQFFLWYDSEKPENITSYKLPFRYLKDGKPANVWRGITAAMAAILGARGGVNIPETDRKKVYNVLVKYYKEHGNEPPEYKDYDNELDILRISGYNTVDEVIEDFFEKKEQEEEQGKSLDLAQVLEEVRKDLTKRLKQEDDKDGNTD